MTRKNTVLIYFAAENAITNSIVVTVSMVAEQSVSVRELGVQRNRAKKVFNSRYSHHAVIGLMPVSQYVNALFAGVVHSKPIVSASVYISSVGAFCLHVSSTYACVEHVRK
jgi:hypothetical protein